MGEGDVGAILDAMGKAKFRGPTLVSAPGARNELTLRRLSPDSCVTLDASGSFGRGHGRNQRT
jgi:hypothetical protein